MPHVLLKTQNKVVDLETSTCTDLQDWISAHLKVSRPMRLLYAGKEISSLSALPEGATVLVIPNAIPISFLDLSVRYYSHMISFPCPVDATISQLKAMLQPRIGLDIEHMIVKSDLDLADSDIIAQAGPSFTVESAIHPKVIDGFPLQVLTLTGKSMQVTLGSANFIDDLYALVSELILINRRRLCSIFAGKDLEQGRTLGDYNIVSHSRIHLIQRLRYS